MPTNSIPRTLAQRLGQAAPIALLLLAACTESGTVAQPASVSNANAISFTGGKTMAVDVSPTNPNTDPRITNALNTLRTQRGGSLRMRRPASWSTPPVYVVAPTLPAGVVYQVVRDTKSATPRVIIFSEATMTDDQLYRSVGRLALDELREPSPAAVRTITMYADNHYIVESAGRTERNQVHNGMSNESAPAAIRGTESRRVLREAAAGDLVTVATGVRGRMYKPAPQ